MTEKDHYKYGLSGDKVDVEVAERLRAQIRELKAQDEVHWKTRRSLLAELERCRAANVYDGNAHRRVIALEAAPNGIDFLQTWMRTPNPQLGGAVPLDMLYQGYGRRLAQFIDSAYEANSAPETKGEV